MEKEKRKARPTVSPHPKTLRLVRRIPLRVKLRRLMQNWASHFENAAWRLADAVPWPTRHRTFFAASVALFSLFFAGHYVMGDHAYRMAWAKVLMENGSHDISAYFPGAKYSVYGFGHTLIHIPFLWLTNVVRSLTGVSGEGAINMGVYVLNAAVALTLIFHLLLRYGVAARSASTRSLAIAVGTPWMAYAKLEYSENLVATALLGMAALLPRFPLAAGLVAGFGLNLRFEFIVWTFLSVWAFGLNRQDIRKFALGVLPGLILMAWANWIRTGNVLQSGYQPGTNFDTPLYVGLYGFLFSSGKSIFLYAPVLLLLPGLFHRHFQNDNPADPAVEGSARLFRWAIVLLAFHLVIFGKWWDWSGEDAWGPRFLIPAILISALFIASERVVSLRWFYALSALGFLVHLPALLLGPHTNLMLTHLRAPERHHWQAGSSRVDIEDWRFNPRFSPVVTGYQLVGLKLFGDGSPEIKRSDRDWSWQASFSPALRSEEIKWDIFWLGAK